MSGNLRIFISFVQTEFAEERASLRDYLRGDPLFRHQVGTKSAPSRNIV